jgi:hypothetical protein
METKPDNTQDDIGDDIGYDLQITKIEPRQCGAGVWVTVSVAGHSFQALVFPGHAECPSYELGDSRISKLWIARQRDKQAVYNWDRGPDLAPADATTAKIVDFLAAGIAEAVFNH